MALFVSGFLLSLSLCLDLGIVNVAILKTGVERGFWPSFLIGLGSCFGDLTFAGLSMVGVSLLLERYAFIRWLLWIGGTAALLYLTVSMLRAAVRSKPVRIKEGKTLTSNPSSAKDFFWGLGLALSSPSAILWFATIGGSIIAATSIGSYASLMQFFAGFFGASVVWSIGLAYVSSKGGKRMGPRLVRSFSIASAILFLYFAARVFMSGYKDLL